MQPEYRYITGMACVLTSGNTMMTERVYKERRGRHWKEAEQQILSVSTSGRNDTFLSGTVGSRNRCSVTFWLSQPSGYEVLIMLLLGTASR